MRYKKKYVSLYIYVRQHTHTHTRNTRFNNCTLKLITSSNKLTMELFYFFILYEVELLHKFYTHIRHQDKSFFQTHDDELSG